MRPAFDSYVAPARAYPQLWRLVAGVALILLFYIGWMGLMALALWAMTGGPGFQARLETLALGSTPWSLILLLATFPGMGLGAWAAARLLHGRGWRSLFGRPAVVLRDFVTGAALMVVIAGAASLLLFPLAPPLEPAVPLSVWLMFLPLALFGVLIQTGAEELVFRGYLQQQLAARFVSPLGWLVLPSVLFGLAHYAPEEMGALAWAVVAATGLFGLVAADLTARTGSLGMAWGLHFVNNVLAILVVSAMGALDGLALFRVPDGAVGQDDLALLILIDMVVVALVWAGCVVWLRRR